MMRGLLRADLNDAMVGDGDDTLLLGSLDGVRCREDLVELLEGSAIGLDGKEVPKDRLDNVPADEDVDVLIADVAKSNS